MPAKTKYAKFKCPNCATMLTHIHQVHNCRAQPPFKGGEPYPFGGVKFDANRMGEVGSGDTTTNGERASAGGVALACFCVTQECHGEDVMADVNRAASAVDLTEAPEDALADLLTNLMHYCHKQGISWFGDDGVSQVALRHFSKESGGAVL